MEILKKKKKAVNWTNQFIRDFKIITNKKILFSPAFASENLIEMTFDKSSEMIFCLYHYPLFFLYIFLLSKTKMR